MNYGKKSVLFRRSSRSIESESVLSFDDLEDDEKDNVKRLVNIQEKNSHKSTGINLNTRENIEDTKNIPSRDPVSMFEIKTRNLSEKKRRDQFNILINELCSMVASNSKKLDKSSVLKSAIQFLKNHQEFSVQSAANEIKENWKPTFLCNEEFAQLMLEAVDSFLVVFTQQGKVLFTSESITSLLGHLPSDLINHSLYDLMHEDDRLKFFNLLSKQQSPEDNSVSFTCHLRRGTIDPMEPAIYEYVRVCGTTQLVNDIDDDSLICNNGDFIGLDFPEPILCYCCTVRLQTSHIIREMSAVDDMTSEFTSRHSLELKFLFLDHRAPPIIGYLPFEVLGTSGYDYYHPDDLDVVSKCHEQLMLLGKGTSKFYRFLTKGQQWIWLQTQYFITYHQWNSKPEFIVCTNTVVGFSDVRKQLRKDLGYTDEDSNTISSNSSSNSGGNPEAILDSKPQQEGHVTSFSQSENVGNMVQSPDVASSQHSDSDCLQQPHSTKQENSSKKHVSSQLQSLLQLHLQRSLAAASSMQAGTTNTSAKCVVSSVAHSSSDTKVSGHLTNSLPTVLSTSNHQTSVGQSRSATGLVPIMAAMSNSLVTMASNHRLLSSVSSSVACQDSIIVSSPLASPIVCTDQRPNTSLILTPAQQLLHEQLVHKSELLQNAIQRQQEELRLIKEQLAFSQNSSQMMAQQQRHQQQQQQQHQYVLQQQLGLPGQSMLLTPASNSQSMLLTSANNSSQLAMMSSSPNHIFLSPVRSVGLELQSHQQQQQQQQQQQSQRQFLQQQQQLVLQHDTGLNSHSMLLSPISSSPQLTMMSSNPNQIFLSPINMDMLTSQSQQQQQQQTLHFLNVTCSSSDANSSNMDLSD